MECIFTAHIAFRTKILAIKSSSGLKNKTKMQQQRQQHQLIKPKTTIARWSFKFQQYVRGSKHVRIQWQYQIQCRWNRRLEAIEMWLLSKMIGKSLVNNNNNTNQPKTKWKTRWYFHDIQMTHVDFRIAKARSDSPLKLLKWRSYKNEPNAFTFKEMKWFSVI